MKRKRCLRSDGETKGIWATREAAQRVIEHQEAAGTAPAGLRTPYKCTDCGWFHIGRTGRTGVDTRAVNPRRRKRGAWT